MSLDKNNSIIPHYFNDDECSFNENVSVLIDRYHKGEKISGSQNIEDLRKNLVFQPIPENPEDIKKVIQEIENNILPDSINMASPLFIGHMTTVLPNFTSTIAKMIVGMNQNIVKVETSKGITLYERQVLAMFHQLIYKENNNYYQTLAQNKVVTFGTVCSGGTVANITALQCARNKELAGVEKNGLTHFSKNRSVIICSELAHYSMQKAIRLLGLGSDNLIVIPVDENQKICLKLFEKKLSRCYLNGTHIIAIVGVAGSTECGSVDPLEEMATIAKLYHVHFHVDAAWGGAFLFSKQHSSILKGIEQADSITIDAHKQLYTPMGMGLLLFKDPEMANFIQLSAAYTIRKNSFDLGQRSFEGSRPANILYLKMSLALFGKSGYEELINKGVENTKLMVKMIEESEDFELITTPQMNIFLYRFIPKSYRIFSFDEYSKEINDKISAFNNELQIKQFQSGKTFVSRTTLVIKKFGNTPITCLRVVMANPLTSEIHLKQILDHQRLLAESIPLANLSA